MAGTSDLISNFMFGTKKLYDLGVCLRFRPYDVFTLRKPYESGFSRTSGNAGNCFGKSIIFEKIIFGVEIIFKGRERIITKISITSFIPN